MATDSQPSRDLFTGVTVLAHKGTFKSFSCLSILLLPISVITGWCCFQIVWTFGHCQLGKDSYLWPWTEKLPTAPKPLVPFLPSCHSPYIQTHFLSSSAEPLCDPAFWSLWQGSHQHCRNTKLLLNTALFLAPNPVLYKARKGTLHPTNGSQPWAHRNRNSHTAWCSSWPQSSHAHKPIWNLSILLLHPALFLPYQMLMPGSQWHVGGK